MEAFIRRCAMCWLLMGWLVVVPAWAAPQLSISPFGYRIVQVAPVSGAARTYDVTARAGVINSGDAATNVTARVTSSTSVVTVLDGDVGFGNVAKTSPLMPVISTDTFKLRFVLPASYSSATLLAYAQTVLNGIKWSISCGNCGQNRPPVANAGSAQTVYVGQLVTLDGSASSDPDGSSLTYKWSFSSVPAGSAAMLSSAAAVKPTFTPDKDGNYVLQLVVSDGQLSSAPAAVTITTQNSAPVANAGADQTARVGTHVQLTGVASTDVDGDSLTYQWTLVSKPTGSAVALLNADPASPLTDFVIDKAGTYLIELVVNDGAVSSTPDTVVISTVNSPPIANAGPDQTARLYATVYLSGTNSSDVDGNALTYRWSLTTPTGSVTQLGSTTSQDTNFVIDKQGTYVAQLIVNDGVIDSDTDTVVISTINSAPVANAGADISAYLGDGVSLNGSASSDADGDGLSYTWSLLSQPTGSAAVINDPYLPETGFVADVVGLYVAQLVVNDGHIDSSPDTAQVTIAVQPDRIPPTISISNPEEGAYTNQRPYTVTGHLNESAALTINGQLATLDEYFQFSQPVSLTEGLNTITVVATDPSGNRATATRHITVDTVAPGAADLAKVQLSDPGTGTLSISGSSGSVEANAKVRVTNLRTGTTVTVTADSSGSFTASIAGQPADELQVQVEDRAGNGGDKSKKVVPGEALPPNPNSVATQLDAAGFTSFRDSIAFLYSGANPVQVGVTADSMEADRVAVIRGQVTNRAGQPVSGVLVTIKDHDEFGYTRTRADGWFDIAANGGGYLAVNYEREGYLPVQRQVDVPWNDYSVLDKVVMIPLDSSATTVVSNNTAVQTHQGAVVNDFRGTRRATLIFPAGTTASMTLPDGTVQTLSSINVRATEYTVGETGLAAMPGELPSTTAYTYAVELSADEAIAASAKHVHFSKEVSVYVDNFIQLPVGTAVPQAYYDYDKVAWVPEADGLVIKVLGITGGLADIDVMGGGNAASVAELAAIGIDADERRALVSLYSAGKTLWRTRVSHFSPYDHNLYNDIRGDDELPPDNKEDNRDDKDKEDDECPGCIIKPQSQSLGESVSIPGTSISLLYASDRALGRSSKRTLTLRLSDETPTENLISLRLTVSVGGKTFVQTYAPAANVIGTFEWDGRDAYGRLVEGSAWADVEITQVYAYIYRFYPSGYAVASERANSFGLPPPPLTLTPAQQTLYGVPLNTYNRSIKVRRLLHTEVLNVSAARGWAADIHHSLDINSGEIYGGDGVTRFVKSSAAVVTNVAGTGAATFNGDDRLATVTTFNRPNATAVGADGHLYISDKFNYRIRRINRSSGRVTTVAGSGVSGAGGDGGQAPAAQLSLVSDIALGTDGSLYIAEFGLHRIRRVDKFGIISTIVGTGVAGFSGDGGDAASATVNTPMGIAIGPDGSLYIADTGNNRIRRVSPDGAIATIAGTGVPEFSGDGGYAPAAGLNAPGGVAIGRDGIIYIADSGNNRVRKVAVNGAITTIAGNGSAEFSGDNAEAISAGLSRPFAVEVDARNVLYVSDGGNTHRLRVISPNGTISTLAGNGSSSSDGQDGFPSVAVGLPSPGKATVAPDGSIYVALPAENRVVRLDSLFISANARTAASVPSVDGLELYEFDNSGRHLRTVDSLTGATKYSFTYGAAGGLSQIADAFGNITVLERNASGRLTAIVAPHGQRTSIGTDSNGYINAVIYPGGEQYRFTYTSLGLLTSYTDPRTNRSIYTYDTQGHLLTDRNAAGGGWTLASTLTDSGSTVAATTGEGRTTAFTTTSAGLLGTGGRTQTTTYSDGTFTSTYKNPDGRITTTDTDGTRVWQDSTPDPRFGMRVPYNRTTSVLLPSGLGNLTTRTRSVTLNSPTHPLGLIQKIDTVSIAGKSWTTSYNATNLQTSVTSPEGRVASVSEDNLRRPLVASVSGVLPIRFAYDIRGRLSEVRQGFDDPDTAENEERITHYRYYDSGASAGWLAAITNSLGQDLNYEYDANGRVTRQIMQGGRSVAFAYDANGNLSSITPPGRSAHMFDYNVLNQLSDYTAPVVSSSSGATRYAFNLDKQLTRVTRPDGQQLDYQYDAAGKLSILQVPLGNYLYNYSPTTGQMVSISAPEGDVLSYTYDGSLPLSQTWSGGVNGTVSVTYNNDFAVSSQTINGNVVAFSYDRDNLLIGAGTLGINRDSGNGRIVTTGQGTVSTEQYHTEFGELEGVDVWVDRSSSTTGPSDLIRNDLQEISGLMEIIWSRIEGIGEEAPVRYCESSLQSVISAANGLPGNLQTFSSALDIFKNCFESLFRAEVVIHDVEAEHGRVLVLLDDIENQIAALNDGTDSQQYVYSEWFDYDQLGRVKVLYDWFEGDADSRQLGYQYDEAGRLTGVTVNGSNAESYSYDSNGNRTQANGNLATYDAQDRLTGFGSVTYTYTANGELKNKTDGSQTTQYTYDVLGNLLLVQLPDSRAISYIVDGQNRRVGRRVNGALMQGFLYQSQTQIVAELDGTGNVLSRFVYGTKANAPDYMIKGGTIYRIISDHLGSPRLIINASTGIAVQRMDYDSFGNVTNDTNPGFQPFGFAGGLYDRDTKLVRFGARDYDPQTGRWTAKDPILFAGRSLNLYGYVLNDPVNLIDPIGKMPILTLLSCAASAVGGYLAVDGIKDAYREFQEMQERRKSSGECPMPGEEGGQRMGDNNPVLVDAQGKFTDVASAFSDPIVSALGWAAGGIIAGTFGITGCAAGGAALAGFIGDGSASRAVDNAMRTMFR